MCVCVCMPWCGAWKSVGRGCVPSTLTLPSFRYLLYVGGPVLRWQRAARANEGADLPKLHAYALFAVRPPSIPPPSRLHPSSIPPPSLPNRYHAHMYIACMPMCNTVRLFLQHRCVHKTQSQKIILIALISYYCVDPSLRSWKDMTASMSLLGRIGCNMFWDRLVEYINNRQKERNHSYMSFDSAIHYIYVLTYMT